MAFTLWTIEWSFDFSQIFASRCPSLRFPMVMFLSVMFMFMFIFVDLFNFFEMLSMMIVPTRDYDSNNQMSFFQHLISLNEFITKKYLNKNVLLMLMLMIIMMPSLMSMLVLVLMFMPMFIVLLMFLFSSMVVIMPVVIFLNKMKIQ